jgi:hypothetical protein
VALQAHLFCLLKGCHQSLCVLTIDILLKIACLVCLFITVSGHHKNTL